METAMKRFYALTFLAIAAALSGCATSHPQTASEFRKAVPGAFMAKVEKYEVNQPYQEIAARIQKMAPKCLDVTVETISQTRDSYQHIVTQYKSTVIVGKEHAELHVQQHHAQGVMNVTKEPEGGYYLMVFDITKLGASKSHVEYYGPSIGFDTMVKAIKGWIDGKNVGCPDLTK